MIIVMIITIKLIIIFLCVFTVWLCVACAHLYRIQARHPFSAAPAAATHSHNDYDGGDDFDNDDDFKACNIAIQSSRTQAKCYLGQRSKSNRS